MSHLINDIAEKTPAANGRLLQHCKFLIKKANLAELNKVIQMMPSNHPLMNHFKGAAQILNNKILIKKASNDLIMLENRAKKANLILLQQILASVNVLKNKTITMKSKDQQYYNLQNNLQTTIVSLQRRIKSMQ